MRMCIRKNLEREPGRINNGNHASARVVEYPNKIPDKSHVKECL